MMRTAHSVTERLPFVHQGGPHWFELEMAVKHPRCRGTRRAPHRDSALAKALLLALDDADDAHPAWFGGVW